MENEQDPLQTNDQPVRIPKQDDKNDQLRCRFEKLLYGTYRKDEVIIFLKNTNSKEEFRKEIETRKESFRKYGFDPKTINVKQCNNCNIPIVLFQAKNIDTVINTSTVPVKSGSGGSTDTVGESLNFFNYLPFDEKKISQYPPEKELRENDNKEQIVVAVLDTGLDTQLVNSKFLWNGTPGKSYPECYKDVQTGWNFIANNDKFHDDNPHKHGSIVSQYIINQFKRSPINSVKIMPLKTHDSKGVGDLFTIICAIHFAIAKGANIINASWGFYYYYDTPMPYLQDLIIDKLKAKGILFVTASGNQVAEEDILAKQIYFAMHNVELTADQLRNLRIHNFYPAHLSSNNNNVLTIATSDEREVSPTQNYSNFYADMGVIRDKVDGKYMLFQIPFNGSSDYVAGSSFATAIATGKIGAFCKKTVYQPNLDKVKVIDMLSTVETSLGVPKIIFNSDPLRKKYIKDGVFIKK